jgi:hypothetical protein
MSVINLASIRNAVGDTGVEIGSVDAGPMSVLSHHWPAGFDAKELLSAAFGEQLCPVAHYFVITKGRIGVSYTDGGADDVGGAGDVIYARPGHTIGALEESDVVEISTADGNAYVMARISATGAFG